MNRFIRVAHRYGYVCLCAVALAACSDSEDDKERSEPKTEKQASGTKEDLTASPVHTLVFVDKTQSLHYKDQDQLNQLCEHRGIHQAVEGALKSAGLPGGKALFYEVNAFTAGATHVHKHVFEKMQGPDQDASGLDKTRHRTKWKKAVEQQRAALRQSYMSLINRPFGEKSALRTDLWGAIEVISRDFEEVANEPRQVILVSDMVEGGPEGNVPATKRRNFHAKPPRSKEEAEAFAKADAETIAQHYKIIPEALTGTDVLICFPSDATDPTQNRQMRYYWEALLGHWGMKVRYH